MFPRICIQESLTSKAVTPCSVSRLLAVMDSDRVQDICDQIRLLSLDHPNGGDDYEEEKSRLKRQLPVITPHAQSFKDNVRKNENAVPSGLAMLDLDDIEEPQRLFEERVAPQLTVDAAGDYVDEAIANFCKANNIYLVHITASGHGLRLIGQRQDGESIAQAQERLAHLLGVSTFDASTKDLARTSFVVPRSYVLYLDASGLEFEDETISQATASRCTMHNAQCTVDHAGASSTENALPFREGAGVGFLSTESPQLVGIFKEVLSWFGGEPSVGNRNNVLYECAKRLRYVTDFNFELIRSLLPTYGLPQSEVDALIRSALAQPRNQAQQAQMQALLADSAALESSTDMDDSEDDSEDNSEDNSASPRLNGEGGREGGGAFAPTFDMRFLPKPVRVLCSKLPEPYRPAMTIATLPVLGALATGVRFRYLDNAIHSLSFLACISAPAATGKSFLKTPVNLLLKHIDEDDEAAREEEQEYKEKLKKARNANRQPDDPHAVIRHIPVTVSIAKLLQRLTYAEGKHLIAFESEIDAMLRSEKAGSWSKKSDFYRKAFDNDMYGQDYLSDNSFSATCNIFYNLLVSGTPDAVSKFFGNVEDGLVTRVAFAVLPDMFGKEMPEFGLYTKREEGYIDAVTESLMKENVMLECPAIDKAITDWLEKHRLHAIENDCRSEDIIRRRAGVMGYRAGMLAFLLNNKRYSRSVAMFATWVAEYIFQNQMAIFGPQFEEVGERQSVYGKKTSMNLLFAKLPVEFTREDVSALRAKMKKSGDPRMTIVRWKEHNLVEKIGNNLYRKISPSSPKATAAQ